MVAASPGGGEGKEAAKYGCYCATKHGCLVCIAGFASEDVSDGLDDDLGVEEKTPVFYVPDVLLDAFFHHPEFRGFTS